MIFCSLARFVQLAASAYSWIVLGAVLASWLRADTTHPIIRFLHRATDPVFLKARKLLPLDMGGLDLSPLIVIVAIYILEFIIVSLLKNLGGCP